MADKNMTLDKYLEQFAKSPASYFQGIKFQWFKVKTARNSFIAFFVELLRWFKMWRFELKFRWRCRSKKWTPGYFVASCYQKGMGGTDPNKIIQMWRPGKWI